MSEQERVEQAQEARIYAAAAPSLYRIIARRRQILLEQIVGEFRLGNIEQVAKVAQLAVLADIENEVRQKEVLFEKLTTEKHK